MWLAEQNDKILKDTVIKILFRQTACIIENISCKFPFVLNSGKAKSIVGGGGGLISDNFCSMISVNIN